MVGNLFLTLAQTAPAPATDTTDDVPIKPNAPAPTQVDTPVVGPSGQTAITHQSGVAQTQPRTDTGSPFNSMVIFVILGVFLVIMWNGTRRDKKKREAVLSAVKKGDRVQMLGGMIGTVVDLRDTEVTLKVDDSSNTRIRFVRSAIQAVVNKAPDKASDKTE